MTGRIVDGIAAERMGFVAPAVPPAQLDEAVEGTRYHGQMNALCRIGRPALYPGETRE